MKLELDYLMDRRHQYGYINLNDPNIKRIEISNGGLLITTNNTDGLLYSIEICYRGRNKKYLCVRPYSNKSYKTSGAVPTAIKISRLEDQAIFVDKTKVMKPKEYLAYTNLPRLKEIYNEIIRLTKEEGYNLVPIELR